MNVTPNAWQSEKLLWWKYEEAKRKAQRLNGDMLYKLHALQEED